MAGLSASQGRTFARVFLFVLKDHLPHNHELFKGLVHLVNIVDMVFSPFFYQSWYKKLEKEIESLLKFVRINLNLDIYPKLHYLIHYPKLISKYGPLRLLSTDQFESAHRHFKERLITSNNHLDIIKTMFKGALYKYSYMYSPEFFTVPYSKLVFTDSPIDENMTNRLSNMYPGENIRQLISGKWYGFLYKVGYFIYLSSSSQTHTFNLIKQIFFVGESIIIYCCSVNFKYEPKIHAFVQIPTIKSVYNFTDVSDNWINPVEAYKIGREAFICPEYKYFE